MLYTLLALRVFDIKWHGMFVPTYSLLEIMLREHGVEAIANVKRAYMEGDGTLSVICYSKEERHPVQGKKRRVF